MGGNQHIYDNDAVTKPPTHYRYLSYNQKNEKQFVTNDQGRLESNSVGNVSDIANAYQSENPP